MRRDSQLSDQESPATLHRGNVPRRSANVNSIPLETKGYGRVRELRMGPDIAARALFEEQQT